MSTEPYKAIQLAVDSLLGTKTTVRRNNRKTRKQVLAPSNEKKNLKPLRVFVAQS